MEYDTLVHDKITFVLMENETASAALVTYGISYYKGNFRENGGEYIDVSKEAYKSNAEKTKRLIAEKLDILYSNGEGFPVVEFKAYPVLHVKIFETVQQM